MKWLKKIIRKLFKKNEIKLIEQPKEYIKECRNNFKLQLKKEADLEKNDENGYKIIPDMNLKDMI